MLDRYLSRSDVLDFIREIKNNPKYNNKTSSSGNIYMDMGNDLALYIFYDALLKYKIVVDDIYLFDEFMEQVDRLYKRLDDYTNLIFGVNKLIGYLASLHLGVKDVSSNEGRRQLIEFIYDKYIKDGYYVHGFSTVYERTIKNNGFISEVYINNYKKMVDVKKIFEKYKYPSAIEKDFNSNKTCFTDDFIMGAHYSIVSPGYFYNMLFGVKEYGSKVDDNGYYKPDYNASTSYLKRFMSNNLFSDEDKKYILDTVLEEWKYINKVPKKVSMIVVKRKLIDNDYTTKLEDFISDDSDVYDVVDRLLSPKHTNVLFDGVLDAADLDVISLDSFYNNRKENDNKDEANIEDITNDNKEFLDTYGTVYIYFIIGALLISFGVIVSMIMLLRGM